MLGKLKFIIAVLIILSAFILVVRKKHRYKTVTRSFVIGTDTVRVENGRVVK